MIFPEDKEYEEMGFDGAARLLLETMDYLQALDPADFDQDNFYDAVNFNEACGCIAAHSYWAENGRPTTSTRKESIDGAPLYDVGMNDSPVVRAIEELIEIEMLDEYWGSYIFECISEGTLSAAVLEVPYYGSTPQDGAKRISEFLNEAGVDTRPVSNELKDLV